MRRCVLVLAAAAAFDEVPFELRDVYGPPPAKAAVELPLLHEPSSRTAISFHDAQSDARA